MPEPLLQRTISSSRTIRKANVEEGDINISYLNRTRTVQHLENLLQQMSSEQSNIMWLDTELACVPGLLATFVLSIVPPARTSPPPRRTDRGCFPLMHRTVRRGAHLHWAAGVQPAPAEGRGERVREGGLSKIVRLFLFGGGLGYLNSSVNSAF